ncbi:MAG: glycine zipper domain-containing protein [Planctomycetota bacterium]
MRTNRSRLIRSTARNLSIVAAAGSLTLATGCNNAGEGALSGAALGALGGLAIGSLSGDAGTGAIIGTVAGGLGGAVIGDQNERRDRNARYSDDY